MFKPGDKIVCNDKKYREDNNIPNKILEVIDYPDENFKMYFEKAGLITIKELKYGYPYHKFISLKYHRKIQIIILNLNINDK